MRGGIEGNSQTHFMARQPQHRHRIAELFTLDQHIVGVERAESEDADFGGGQWSDQSGEDASLAEVEFASYSSISSGTGVRRSGPIWSLTRQM
jgi:hypothetical protein